MLEVKALASTGITNEGLMVIVVEGTTEQSRKSLKECGQYGGLLLFSSLFPYLVFFVRSFAIEAVRLRFISL